MQSLPAHSLIATRFTDLRLVFMSLMSFNGQNQNVNIATAVYWLVTMTTLGYGDIVFKSEAWYLFTIFVSLSGIAILWAVVVPFDITPILERMIRAAPTSAPEKMNGHIIISGYNSLVETLAERFSLLKVPFLVIEWSESVAKSIYKNYPVLWGDPSSAEVLRRASISSARLLIANENDELNA